MTFLEGGVGLARRRIFSQRALALLIDRRLLVLSLLLLLLLLLCMRLCLVGVARERGTPIGGTR